MSLYICLKPLTDPHERVSHTTPRKIKHNFPIRNGELVVTGMVWCTHSMAHCSALDLLAVIQQRKEESTEKERKKERSGYKEYEETEREERKKEIKGNCLWSKTNPKWPTTPVNWASWLCTNEHEMK